MSFRSITFDSYSRLKVRHIHQQGAPVLQIVLDSREDANDGYQDTRTLDVERDRVPFLIAALQAVYDETHPSSAGAGLKREATRIARESRRAARTT